MEPTLVVILVVIGGISLFLITRRWFWLIVFGVGGLASAFTTIACIIHFQILWALGAFFLTGFCWFIASIINDTEKDSGFISTRSYDAHPIPHNIDVFQNNIHPERNKNYNFDERVLCIDGNCIGIIGDDGRCNNCGKLQTLE